MPTPPLPTRQQVEQAQPLDFVPAPRAERNDISICIEVAPDGLHVRCDYIGPLSTIPAAIERLRAAGVLDLVKPAQPAQASPATGQQQRQRAERVEPEYNSAGDPLCPKHHKPLKNGQWGLFCPAKDDSTARGYCAIRFSE